MPHKQSEGQVCERLERLLRLVETVPAYLYSVELRNGVPSATEHGRGCIAVTGYAPEDYARDPNLWISMVHPDDRASVTEHIARELRDLNPGPMEHRIVHRDGSTRWIRNTIVHRHDASGGLVGYDGLIEDITERKAARIALEKARDELERRVEERTAQLLKLNEKLREALARLEAHDRERVQFVSSVSHDLKTPVTAITYAVENLLRGIGGVLTDKTAEYLRMMRDDAGRLRRTVEDILDLTRADEGLLTLNRVPIPFVRFVRRTVDSLRGIAEAKALYFSLRESGVTGFVDCDPSRTERAVVNIVHNAIKFTPTGGAVELLLAVESGGRFLTLEVTDTGIGIPADKLPLVGTRYFRAAEGFPGSGLGLVTAQKVMQMQGGGIQIASPPPGREKGTRVQLRFPAAAPPLVLIAAREESTRALLGREVTARGYAAVSAPDAKGLLDMLHRDKVALIIADLDMPDAGGMEMISAIKANSSWRRIPVIVLAAETADRELSEMLKHFDIPVLRRLWSEENLLDLIYEVLVGRHLFG